MTTTGENSPPAIVGCGLTEITRTGHRSNIDLAAEAIRLALEDAAISRADVDGLIVPGGFPRGTDYDEIVIALGLDVQYCSQTWSHGRMIVPALIEAVLAIQAGLANCILLPRVSSFAKDLQVGGESNPEEFREFFGAHGENPLYGFGGPIGGAAMAMQKYLNRYGGSMEQAAAIPIAQRKHASLNPGAVFREPFTLEDYSNSRLIVEPLRIFDCAAVTDGAGCLVVARGDWAGDHVEAPVYVHGFQSLTGSREETPFALRGLGIHQQTEFDYVPDSRALYEMAGIGQADVDTLGVLDAFTPATIATLERFGFTKPGETLSWIQNGRIEIGGELPLNTSGGHLSEGHLCGYGQVVEGVRQLQGVCGDRQVEDAEWFQFAHAAGDSLILGKHQSGS